jgi:hypothetical protein
MGKKGKLPVVRLALGELHGLVQEGAALLVFQNYVVGVARCLNPPLRFERGSCDEEIADAYERWGGEL